MLDRLNTLEAFEDHLNTLQGYDIIKEYDGHNGVMFIVERPSTKHPHMVYRTTYSFDSDGDKVLKVSSLVDSEGSIVAELKREQYKRGFSGLDSSSIWGRRN
jgi:hypothetical protein